MEQENKRVFHIGMRNIKTALSVFLCLLLYRVLNRDGDSMACTAAIICMQSSVEQSFKTGIYRMQGTFVGALFGMIFLYTNQILSLNLGLVLAPVGIVLIIAIFNYAQRPSAIVIATVVFLVILLQYNQATPLLYSIHRLVDTLIGIVIAVAVNLIIKNPDKVKGYIETPILADEAESTAQDREAGIQQPETEEKSGPAEEENTDKDINL